MAALIQKIKAQAENQTHDAIPSRGGDTGPVAVCLYYYHRVNAQLQPFGEERTVYRPGLSKKSGKISEAVATKVVKGKKNEEEKT